MDGIQPGHDAKHKGRKKLKVKPALGSAKRDASSSRLATSNAKRFRWKRTMRDGVSHNSTFPYNMLLKLKNSCTLYLTTTVIPSRLPLHFHIRLIQVPLRSRFVRQGTLNVLRGSKRIHRSGLLCGKARPQGSDPPDKTCQGRLACLPSVVELRLRTGVSASS